MAVRCRRTQQRREQVRLYSGHLGAGGSDAAMLSAESLCALAMTLASVWQVSWSSADSRWNHSQQPSKYSGARSYSAPRFSLPTVFPNLYAGIVAGGEQIVPAQSGRQLVARVAR
jgi:hypothetical protein